MKFIGLSSTKPIRNSPRSETCRSMNAAGTSSLENTCEIGNFRFRRLYCFDFIKFLFRLEGQNVHITVDFESCWNIFLVNGESE